MKYVSILIPELGPLGDTFFDANIRAMVAALFVNNPSGGYVESVLTLDIHRSFLPVAIEPPFARQRLNYELSL